MIEIMASIFGLLLFILLGILPLTALGLVIHTRSKLKQLEDTVAVLQRRLAMMDEPEPSSERQKPADLYPDDPKRQSWQAPVKSASPEPLGPRLERDGF